MVRADREWLRIVAVLALVLVPAVFIVVGSIETGGGPSLPQGLTHAAIKRAQDNLERGDYCGVLFPGALRLDEVREHGSILVFALSGKGLKQIPRAKSDDKLWVDLKLNEVVDFSIYQRPQRSTRRFRGFSCEHDGGEIPRGLDR